MSRSVSEESVRQSSFVFLGTVTKVDATTTLDIPVAKETVVVRVVEVLKAPPALAGYQGKDVTVKLQPGQEVTVRESRIFYTQGWIVGESLGVKAIHHEPASDTTEFREDFAATTQNLADKALRARIKDAQLVIVGKVTSVKAARIPIGPLTLHDADWHEAHVNVVSVLRGTLKKHRIAIYFPNSPHPRWSRFPKFKLGDQNIFILHRGKIREILSLPESARITIPRGEGYAAFDSLDVQDENELGRINRLMESK